MFILLQTIETFLTLISNETTDTDLRVALSTHVTNMIHQHYSNIATEIQNKAVKEYNEQYEKSIVDSIDAMKQEILNLEHFMDNDYSMIDRENESGDQTETIPRNAPNELKGKLSEDLEAKHLQLDKLNQTLTEYRNSYYYNNNLPQIYEDMKEAFRHITELKDTQDHNARFIERVENRVCTVESAFEEESKPPYSPISNNPQ